MGKMIHLTTLNYEDNNLGTITSLPVLPNLESLNLSSCHITTFPRLTGFKKLKKLNLSSNSALVLPAEGLELPSLEEFICINGKLTRLPSCTLKWGRLTKLDISSSVITSLFDERAEAKVISERLSWPNLKFANISNNKLQAFPEALLNSVLI
jgi:Leucine-rich repeat (LRR) protein